MLTPWEFFTDLTNPLLVFLPKALLVAVVCSMVAGVIGSHVVLRGMAFIGDAVAHSVFPAWRWPSCCRGPCWWEVPWLAW